MPSALTDARYALRMLRKNRTFAITALMTLALGIGANTAVFSVAYGVFLRPLPFSDGDRLVLVWGIKQDDPATRLPVSQPDLIDIEHGATALAGVIGVTAGWMNLAGDPAPEQIQYGLTSANLLALLGVQPAQGRLFRSDEDALGIPPVAVVSHDLWQRRFGATTRLTHEALTLDGKPYEIIGVLPAGFRFMSFPQRTEVWLPFGVDPFAQRRYARGARSLGVVARLAPGATIGEAQRQLDVVATQMAQANPGTNTGRRLLVEPLDDQTAGGLQAGVMVLCGAVGFVLLIACANVANLLLSRAAARRREMAVRAALGASRARLVAQLLIESAVLGLLGGALGLLVATWTLDLLRTVPYTSSSFFTPYIVDPSEIRLDPAVLAFACLVSLVASVLFGAIPAIHASRPGLLAALASNDGRTTRSGWRRLPQRALVMSEVALAVMVLVGAALMLQSLARLQRVDPGFQSEEALTFDVSLPDQRYPTPTSVAQFYERLIERLDALAGVSAAGAVEYLPFSGMDSSTGLHIDGRPSPRPGEEPQVHYRSVTPSYFSTMGVSVVEGRGLTERDDERAARVAVVSRHMAHSLWPAQSPLGQRIALTIEALRFFRDRAPELNVPQGLREVVGVMSDVRHASLTSEPFAEMYVPMRQRPVRRMTLVLRTAGSLHGLPAAIVQEVRAIDANQPIANVRPLGDLVRGSVAGPRFTTMLLVAFGGLALTLVVIGVYGVMSYAVMQRTREIGIRMALGGRAADVARMVLGQGLALVAVGAALGVAGALALTRVLSTLLFQIRPTDPMTYVATVLLIGVVGLAACAIPARRATRIDPGRALRAE